MFDNLSDKLQRVFKNLRGEGRLTAQNMDEALREIRMALLEADVHFKVVKQFIEQVKEKALGEEVLTALSPSQQVVKIVRDELVKMLGGHQSRLRFANEPPTVILMVGLQGSGKTTTTAKLARVLGKEGVRPQLVSVDVYRPAARQQLAILAKQIGMPAYEGLAGETPLELARGARREAVQTGRDVVLVDTAGRQHIDDQLMQELAGLKEALAPTEILFVADAMTGQDAVRSADEFHKRLGITGSVLTKMDGDARGGAALSIRSVTGQPLKYVGVGERVDALEAFHPDRVAERILGMGDVLSLIEKVEEHIDKKQAEKMQEKLLAGDEFTLEDFRDQIKQIRKLGPLEGLLKMMPGAGALKELKDAKIDEKEVTRIVAIVDSMTPRERRNHMIINGSRRRRIAKGSGTSVQEINNLLKQYAQARKMMKSFSGVAGLLGKKGGKLRIPGLPGF
jgi:signal recognition particle subunit SRP54